MTPFEHERYRDMAAPYALGALDAEECVEFKQHLGSCDECTRLVSELAQPVSALPLAVPQVAPPPGLRDRVMSAIAQERAADRTEEAEPSPSSSSSWSRFTRAQYALAATIAVLAIAAASLFGWAMGLRSDVDSTEGLLARSYDALSVMARADQRWNVQATDAAPGGWGVVAFDSRSGMGSVVMWGLDESPDVQYNVWVVDGGQRQRVGRLYAADGGFWTLVNDSLPAEGIGVTAVDASGSAVDVLDAQLSPQ